MKHHHLRWVRSLFLVSLFILILLSPTTNLAKELPMLVNLSEIGETFDGKRVTIFGWARSDEVKTGRRGSLYLEVIVGNGEYKIMVFSTRPVHNIVDREVIVH